MQQWITAFEKVANSSHWTGRNRFDSFAPIRLNVAAQWLVDGVCILNFITEQKSPHAFSQQRDYMWNLSRAVLLARERIYIHDWWLSPGTLRIHNCSRPDAYPFSRTSDAPTTEGTVPT